MLSVVTVFFHKQYYNKYSPAIKFMRANNPVLFWQQAQFIIFV